MRPVGRRGGRGHGPKVTRQEECKLGMRQGRGSPAVRCSPHRAERLPSAPFALAANTPAVGCRGFRLRACRSTRPTRGRRTAASSPGRTCSSASTGFPPRSCARGAPEALNLANSLQTIDSGLTARTRAGRNRSSRPAQPAEMTDSKRGVWPDSESILQDSLSRLPAVSPQAAARAVAVRRRGRSRTCRGNRGSRAAARRGRSARPPSCRCSAAACLRTA